MQFAISHFASLDFFLCLSAVLTSGTFHSASAQKSQKSDERPLQALVTARTHHSTNHGYCLVCSFTYACLAFKCSGPVFTLSVSSVRLLILTLITTAAVNRPNCHDVALTTTALQGSQLEVDLHCRDLWNWQTCLFLLSFSAVTVTFKDIEHGGPTYLTFLLCWKCFYYIKVSNMIFRLRK